MAAPDWSEVDQALAQMRALDALPEDQLASAPARLRFALERLTQARGTLLGAWGNFRSVLRDLNEEGLGPTELGAYIGMSRQLVHFHVKHAPPKETV